MATYLITGIAGFIGSSLAHALLAKGHTVRGIDNLITGKRENLEEILPRIDFREASILDPDVVRSACTGADFVLHQAALASVPRSVKDPITTNLNNVDGTLNVLEAAREGGVRRVVYAASSSAYGDSVTLPKHEQMVPAPISPYAVSKLTAEHYCAAYFRTYGLETVALRYFNVFGPRQDSKSEYSGVLAKFITMMLRGEKPTIDGDGEQSRDFTFIQNVVSANLLACEASPDAAGRVLNVGTGERSSLNQTFQLLKEMTGFSGDCNYGPARIGDVKHSLADISLASKYLVYQPMIRFREGLQRTVDWYKTTSAI